MRIPAPPARGKGLPRGQGGRRECLPGYKSSPATFVTSHYAGAKGAVSAGLIQHGHAEVRDADPAVVVDDGYSHVVDSGLGVAGPEVEPLPRVQGEGLRAGAVAEIDRRRPGVADTGVGEGAV